MLESIQVGMEVRCESDEWSDDQLVELAKSDPVMFGTLYDRYLTLIYQYCRWRLPGVEAAEDATSIIFTKALTAIPQFHPGRGTFRAWLFTIAHHTVVDEIRAYRHGHLPLSDEEPKTIATGGRSTGPEAQALANDTARELYALLQALPPGYARVVELRLAGLTDGEIATVLGRSQVAVRIVHHRALKRLRTVAQAKDWFA